MHESQLAPHDELYNSGLRYHSSSILVSSAIHTNTRYRTSHVTNSKQYVQPCLLYKEVRSPLQALQSVLGAKQVLKNMLLLFMCSYHRAYITYYCLVFRYMLYGLSLIHI